MRARAQLEKMPSSLPQAHRRPRSDARAIRRFSWFLCSALMLMSPRAAGAAGAQTEPAARPKIGLALSGGGARGAAHIGVLKVLEEHRIPIDYIAGTSMGSIVGGLYASGMSAAELEEMISHVDWADAFSDFIPREDRSFRRKRDDDLYLVKNKPGISGKELKFPTGILDGQKIDLLLKRYTLPVARIRDFDELGIPFRAVAADLATGAAVVIGEGDLARAMRASMSIPVAFAPREIDGRLLTDGGISINLPIDVVRRMGADIVIAVDISSPLLEREALKSVIAVADQLTGIMTRRNTEEQIASLTEKDIFICPDLGTITTASFGRAVEAIPAGVEAAEAAADKLARLSISAEEYAAYAAGRLRSKASPVIDEVRIVNESRLADAVIAERIRVETGRPLDVDRLEKDIEQVFGLELFESIYYDITGESDRTVLTITARERSWGPNYIQSGVVVFEDFEGPNFNLAAAYARTAVNRLNGEWRTGVQIGQEPEIYSEFHQPLAHSLRPFVYLKASFGERAENVFDADGNKISELNLRRVGIELSGGRELGTWGELRTGIIRESGTIETLVGEPDAPEVDFDTGELFAQIFADELDDVDFPRSGGAARIRASAARTDLGSSCDYEQGLVEGELAHSIGSYTGRFAAYFATTRDGDAPYERLFRLGGFSRLSGLERRELAGQHAALLSLMAYRRIADLSLLSMYAGLTLEYGNVFEERERMQWDAGIWAGSAFLGLRTPIGPMYMAYGWAERDRGNFYLFLGHSI